MLRFLLVLALLLQPLQVIASTEPAPVGSQRRVMVLPFETPANQPDLRHFGPGTMEALITGLKNVPSFVLVDRSRIDRAIREQQLALADPQAGAKVGKLLGAQVLIAGSLQTAGRGAGAGRQVRLTAHFIDIQTGKIQQSKLVSGALSAIFDLQRQLAGQFIAQQQVAVTPEQQQRMDKVLASTASLTAYDYYLKGRQAFLLYTPAGFQEAVKWYRQAIVADPRYALAHAALAEAWSFSGYQKERNGEIYILDNQKAYDTAQQALALNPDLAVAHRALGNALASMKKPGRLEHAERAVALEPNGAENWYELWLASGNKANPDHRYVLKALELNPDLVAARIDRGISLKNAGRLDEAVAEYRAVLKSNPNDASAHINLGIALKNLKRFDEALAEYREALRIHPGSALAYSNLGTLMYAQKRYQEALDAYKEALRINPDDPINYVNLAFPTGLMPGGAPEAIKLFETYLKMTPNAPDAERIRGIIGRLSALK